LSDEEKMNIMKSNSNMSMMKNALDHSWIFVRGLSRFSFRDSIKHKSKVIHRAFRLEKRKAQTAEESGWKNVLYWTVLLSISLAILIASLSFISQPEKFFSKSHGIYAPDIIKFLILPTLSFLALGIWFVYSLFINQRRMSKKKKYKHAILLRTTKNKTETGKLKLKNKQSRRSVFSIQP
jgi:hypothetical protein